MADDLSIFDDDEDDAPAEELRGMAKLLAEQEDSSKNWSDQLEKARLAQPGLDDLLDPSVLNRINDTVEGKSVYPVETSVEGSTSNDAADVDSESSVQTPIDINEESDASVVEDTSDESVPSDNSHNQHHEDATDSSQVATPAESSKPVIDDPFGNIVVSDDEEDDFDPDSFDDDANAFEANDLDEEDADEELDDEVLDQVVEEEDVEREAEEEELLQSIENERYLNETSLDGATERAKSHVVDILSRNPEPMTQDQTRIDEDRPMSGSGNVVEPGSSKPEPLKMEGSQANVKIPTVLMNTIRAIAIQSLTNTTVELTPKQQKQARGHAGSVAYDKMSDKQKRETWIDYVNKNFPNNRLVIAFLAAQANIDIEGLDETTAMIVDELRCVDPVLRELHTNTANVMSLLDSEQKTRDLNSEMLQTLKGLELALSFMVSWTTLEGSRGVSDTRPSQLNIASTNTKIVRDRLQKQTKLDLIELQRRQGRPIG